MRRLPHRSDFRLRLAFSDADGLPVSMAGVDIDLWFTTRPGSPVYFAGARAGICTRCEILDDGSLVVIFDDHRLAPGQLKVEINIHSDDESMPDGKRDINLKPVIPLELTDSQLSRPLKPQADMQQPILVNVTIPISRPQLSAHVTRDELQTAIKTIRKEMSEITPCDMKLASDEEIDRITALFSDPPTN